MIDGRARVARWGLIGLLLVLVLLAVASLAVGAGSLGAAGAPDYLAVSRIPRTISLILAGASISVCGLLMQVLTRNRFVEPATAGLNEAAALGVVLAAILAPGLPVAARLAAAVAAAMAGTAIFMVIVRRTPGRDALTVPLIGLMFGGVIGAVATLLALRFDLMQSLASLGTANFSGVLQGRYELLWLVGVVAIVAIVAADRITLAGLGDDVAANLGVSAPRITLIALGVVSMTVAVVVVHVGALPFLGLIVPNALSLVLGDQVRRTAPWAAVAGAALTLACDLIGRLIRFPYELPAGVIMAVFGAALFLTLLVRAPRGRRA